MKRSLLIAFILVAFFAVFIKYVFTIKTIDVGADQGCLTKENIEDKEKLIAKNIFFVKTSLVEKNLKKENSCLESVSINRKLPSTLEFTVKAKVPVAKIDGTDLLATGDGLVIKQQANSNIPTIYLPGNIKAAQGEIIKDDIVIFALKVAAGLLKSDFTPASIRIVGSGDIAVYSTNETVALFSSQMSASSQVDSLQSILTKAKIDAAKIAKLDLRFDKPIIILK